MTTRVALPFPVLPDKGEADVRRIAELLASDPEQYWESRRRAGVTLERGYFQPTAAGNFLVSYLESEQPIGQVLAAPAQSDLDVDRRFLGAVREVHGVDLTQPPPGPPPETIGEWVDTAVTDRRRGLAFSAPLNAGQEERARAWAQSTFNSDGMTSSRRALGQNVEVMTLVRTPAGPVIGVYLEGEDPIEGNRQFAASTDPFDVAFKNELRALFPPLHRLQPATALRHH